MALRDEIIEALKRVGIPRARFQLAQLVGRKDGELAYILKDMVIRGEIDVVPGSVPKLYRLPAPKPEKIHDPWKVAGEIGERYRGYRFWGGYGRLQGWTGKRDTRG